MKATEGATAPEDLHGSAHEAIQSQRAATEPGRAQVVDAAATDRLGLVQASGRVGEPNRRAMNGDCNDIDSLLEE